MSWSVANITAVVFAAVLATIASANAVYINIIRETIAIGINEQRKITADVFFYANIVVAVLAFAYLLLFVWRIVTGNWGYEKKCREILESNY